jgi:hypothetical protein
MEEDELEELEVKNNNFIRQLNSFSNPNPKAPLSTPVHAVQSEYSIIRDPGKTITFKLPLTHSTKRTKSGWGRKKACQVHQVTKTHVSDLLIQQCRKTKTDTK